MWIKTVFAVLIGITVLNGICGVIINHFDKPVWNRHRLVTGMVLSAACAVVFILTRQPYTGIICLAILIVKGVTDWKREEYIIIKNERIKIYPASSEQMEKHIASEADR